MEGEFKIFHKLLPSGKIIEIGCGGGRDAKLILQSGYKYLGTDISEGMVTEARNNNPSGKFEVKSVYDFDYPKNIFDGFWASTSLLHIPKSKIKEALSNIHRVVRDKGVGFIAIKEGSGEKLDEKDDEVRRFWSYYTLDEFTEVLQKNRFKIIEKLRKPMSEKTTFLIYFVEVEKNT